MLKFVIVILYVICITLDLITLMLGFRHTHELDWSIVASVAFLGVLAWEASISIRFHPTMAALALVSVLWTWWEHSNEIINLEPHALIHIAWSLGLFVAMYLQARLTYEKY